MFETGTAVSVTAFHVMPGAPPPEGELHSHDYRIEVTVSRRELDERGMVVDLDVLEAVLAAVRERLDGRDLEEIRPPDAEAVTVELLAQWVHAEIGGQLGGAGAEQVAVRVYESAVAFGGYRAAVGTTSS